MLKDLQEVTSGKWWTVSPILSLEKEWSSFSLHWLTVKRYLLYAALFRCGHQRAIALYLKAINICLGASLVVQWLRILPPMQGTQVQFLVLEDSTCLRATQPSVPQLLSPCTYFLAYKVACACQRRPTTAKNKTKEKTLVKRQWFDIPWNQ